MIKILHPGIRTTIQDLGRTGYYHLGVPPSGAADKHSYMIGHILLGNSNYFASLEMMVEGATIEFKKKTTAVITGAPMNTKLNGKSIPMWKVFEVNKGDILECGQINDGLFSYLTISAGFNVPTILNSQSTCLASGFTNYSGRTLLTGDEIYLNEPLPGAMQFIGKTIHKSKIPKFLNSATVHVVLGIHTNLISDDGLVSLLSNEWTLSTNSSPTASRLTGGQIKYNDYSPPFGSGGVKGNVVDIPYPIGAVIVPNEDEIIILLHEGTGGGGFVTIGTILFSDVSTLSQLRPLSTVRFKAITIEQAIEIRQEREKLIKNIRKSLEH